MKSHRPSQQALHGCTSWQISGTAAFTLQAGVLHTGSNLFARLDLDLPAVDSLQLAVQRVLGFCCSFAALRHSRYW